MAGHEGSHDTTLSGLGARLSDGKRENLEPGFPTSSAFTAHGQPMTAQVFAFKRGKADTYKKREGVVFTVNGQTHGNLDQRFFSRRSVKMNRLEESILVIVDCSRIGGRDREDLFMNSRDRMERGEFLSAIEGQLETILKDDRLLRALREQRRREDVESKLEDAKPFKAGTGKHPAQIAFPGSIFVGNQRTVVRSIQVTASQARQAVSWKPPSVVLSILWRRLRQGTSQNDRRQPPK